MRPFHLIATAALPLLLLAPAPANAAPARISRDAVMERAASWGVGAGRIPYSWYDCYSLAGNWTSQTPCGHGAWRADCSGFVSMAWNTDNWLTVGDPPRALTGVAGASSLSSPIAYRSLRAGDALAYQDYSGAGAHIVLFARWADPATKRRPVIWELAGSSPGPRERTWSPSYADRYTAWRYDRIG